MLLVFVDETSDSKFRDYFGLSVVTINHIKYAKLKSDFQKILQKSKWDESIEFKGSCLFSAKSGDTKVTVEERVEIAEKIVDLNIAKKNASMNFFYLKHKAPADRHGQEYIRLLPLLLKKAVAKAPSGAGKNIVAVHCDHRDDILPKKLNAAILPVFSQKKYIMLEETQMFSSNFNTVGILYADIIGYLVGRIDTISNDSELFEDITPDEYETNGKIRKLRSSANLIAKIKNIQKYEVRVD